MKIEFDVAPSQKPEPTEQICLISYEVTKILLGDEPAERPAFWKTYRQELAHNQKTKYDNYRLSVCRNLLRPLESKLTRPWYFRNGALTTEREVAGPKPAALPKDHIHP